jgi:hypothetical protein
MTLAAQVPDGGTVLIDTLRAVQGQFEFLLAPFLRRDAIVAAQQPNWRPACFLPAARWTCGVSES